MSAPGSTPPYCTQSATQNNSRKTRRKAGRRTRAELLSHQLPRAATPRASRPLRTPVKKCLAGPRRDAAMGRRPGAEITMENLEQVAGAPTADLEKLQSELRQRDTYIHELHLKL